MILTDSKGVIYKGRTIDMTHYKEEFAADTDRRTLTEALQGADVFVGLSVGGMVGMTLALKSPERLHKLALCSTGAKIGTRESWDSRIEMIRTKGIAEIARATPQRWFTPDFVVRSPEIVAATVRNIESMNPEGYIGGCCAVRDFDAQATVSQIRVPTLVVSATHDPAAPPAAGQFLAHQIPAARYVELNASHVSNVEDAANFTKTVFAFLTE